LIGSGWTHDRVRCANEGCSSQTTPYESGLLPWSKEEPWRLVKWDEQADYVAICSDACQAGYEGRREQVR
jgi:hypothetical protein